MTQDDAIETDAVDASTLREDIRRQRDWRFTFIGLTTCLLGGLLAVVLRFALGSLTSGTGNRQWNVTGQSLVAVVWAMAWFAAGFALGFLFGIPKTGQGPVIPGGSDRPRVRVNSNLEEISDWLTKVLVGATVTQLVTIPAAIQTAASYMARSAGVPQHESIFAAMIVYFTTVGFFGGYVMTRMFLSGAFVRSDGLLNADSAQTVLRNVPLVPSDEPYTSAVSKAVRSAAKDLGKVELSLALTSEEAIAIARGARLIGNTDRALEASRIAVDKNPGDPRARIEHAYALQRSGAHSQAVLRQLDKAHEAMAWPRLGNSEELFNALVYLALYQDAPEGFSRAIEWAKEFIVRKPPRSASIWTNLACAYGQRYEYEKARTHAPEALESIRTDARMAIQKALETSSAAIERLRQLADPNSSGIDHDLAVLAADDPSTRQLLAVGPQEAPSRGPDVPGKP